MRLWKEMSFWANIGEMDGGKSPPRGEGDSSNEFMERLYRRTGRLSTQESLLG